MWLPAKYMHTTSSAQVKHTWLTPSLCVTHWLRVNSDRYEETKHYSRDILKLRLWVVTGNHIKTPQIA